MNTIIKKTLNGFNIFREYDNFISGFIENYYTFSHKNFRRGIEVEICKPAKIIW